VAGGAGRSLIRAAGGVVRRDGDVLVVHRPKYDDWSLPKGKLEADESFEDAALREVEEETGWRCELGEELEPTRYADSKGRDKLVRWWEMRPLDRTGWQPDGEVDEVRWVPREEAPALLTYVADRELLHG
jgi:8-oxo-dGTP diphosphatase